MFMKFITIHKRFPLNHLLLKMLKRKREIDEQSALIKYVTVESQASQLRLHR